MSRGRESLLVLLALVSAVAAMEMTCTRLERKCVDHHPCINRTCVCPPPQHGDALLACARPDEDICLIRADPHALTYGLAKGDICLPCRYRVAKFQVPVEGSGPNSGCSFEIFAFNIISQSGKYFAAGVEVSLRVGSFNAPAFAANVLKFEINHAGAVSSMGSNVNWGDSAHSTHNGVTISCRFEVDQNYAIFNIPECGTTVRFRPYKESDEPGAQVLMPGIAIISPKRAIFGSDSQYPNYLCGTPQDSDSLFRDRGLELGVNNTHAAILHDVLQQGTEIGFELLIRDQTRLLLPNSAECNRVIQAFHKCPVQRRPEAIRVCGQIMSSRRIIRCLRMDVLETFIFCLDAFCSPPSSCPQLLTMFRLAMRKDAIRCRPPRSVRRNVNCTFLY